MRVVILTTDNREHLRDYELAEPVFGPAIEAALQGLAGVAGLEVHVVSCTQRPMHAPVKIAENTWFHLLLVPKLGWLRTGYQGCIRAIRRKVREIKPDLVHGQGTERECALGAVFSGRPNVVTIHGNMRQVARSLQAPFAGYYWCAAVLEALALRRTGGVFCNSAYTESVVAPCTRRTWRVPNAVRKEFFDVLPERAEKTVVTLLNIGLISPYKRQNELLTVAEELHREGHRFEWLFVGAALPNTAYADIFFRRIAAAEQDGFARYLGTKTTSQILALLDTSEALVHTPAEESFGLVVAEALARNLKLFAADIGGVRDVASGVEGVEMFDLEDTEGLRAGIAAWLGSGAGRPAEAAAEMKKRFHPDVVAARQMEVYAQFLNMIRPRS